VPEPQVDPLSTVFRALADPTRREMLRNLAAGERTVSELARPFAMSLADVLAEAPGEREPGS
jgi:DNA-binding transcriptional ArsR family regulator